MESVGLLKLKNKKFIHGILFLSVSWGVVIMLGGSGYTFNINAVAPSISAAAALKGITQAAKLYKAGKSLKLALTVAFSWTVISLVIFAIGEALVVNYLLKNAATLAKW